MAAKVTLDSVTLNFPISDVSEKLTQEDVAEYTGVIGSRLTDFTNNVSNWEFAMVKTTFDDFEVAGIEEISSIIEQDIITPAQKLQTTTFNEAYNRIIELQQQQTEKDIAILDAYNLALKAKAALEKRHSKYLDYQDRLAEYKEALAKADENTYMGFMENSKNTARKQYQEACREYNAAEEEALAAYKAARNMEPNESGDYDMTEI